MIQNPYAILLLLAAVVAAILGLSRQERAATLFKYMPVPLWCYFIPTLLATFGVVPSDSPLYGGMSQKILPACLFLLLLGSDLPSIVKMSHKALGAMLAGSAGIFIGAAVTFPIFMSLPIADTVRPEIWKGWGCLSATWTGGSANMLAVKEMLQTPEAVFSNLIITDTVIAYSWMALLVFLSHYQTSIDRFLKAEPFQFIDSREKNAEKIPVSGTDAKADAALEPGLRVGAIAVLLAAGFAFSLAALKLGALIPLRSKAFTSFSWAIVLATTIPLLLSLTPVKKLEGLGAGRLGTLLLYLLLTSIGARANLTSLTLAPTFIALGILWVTLHGAILLLYGRLARVPVALLASASQANVGGPVSTPLVATVYQREIAPLGVLMAVLGNIYGTYAGLLMAHICRWFSNLL